MSPSDRFLQAILAVLNVILLGFSGLVIYAGFYLFERNGEKQELIQLSYAIMSIGGFTAAVGLGGFFGSFCRSRCLLIGYAVLLIVLIVGQIVIGALAYSASQDNDKVAYYADTLWNEMTPEFRTYFQESRTCCGYARPSTIVQLPGNECGVFSSSCIGYFEQTVQQLFHSTGLYLFIAAGFEVIAALAAFAVASESGPERKVVY